MAARKKVIDPVVDLEEQIAKLTAQLTVARNKRIAAAEKAFTQTKSKLGKAQQKLVQLRERAKNASASGRKTPRAIKARDAVAAQQQEVASLRELAVEQKENVALLLTEKKRLDAIAKMEAKADKTIRAKSKRPPSKARAAKSKVATGAKVTAKRKPAAQPAAGTKKATTKTRAATGKPADAAKKQTPTKKKSVVNRLLKVVKGPEAKPAPVTTPVTPTEESVRNNAANTPAVELTPPGVPQPAKPRETEDKQHTAGTGSLFDQQ